MGFAGFAFDPHTRGLRPAWWRGRVAPTTAVLTGGGVVVARLPRSVARAAWGAELVAEVRGEPVRTLGRRRRRARVWRTR